MIKVCSLSSGSNGNCFYIKTGNESFLVDAGISCRQMVQRLRLIGSDIDQISGIFVTHEHSDHIRGLPVLMRKHPKPVYITEKTYYRSNLDIDRGLLKFIQADGGVSLNGTRIQSLSKSHDAVDPTLFSFYYKGKKVSIVTDAGHACGNVIAAVKDAHVVFLETNYDENMLWAGPYPHLLKKRIASTHGHLSNVHAAQLIHDHAGAQLSHVFLSHLSENNNTPDMAMSTFLKIVGQRNDLSHLKALLTSRHEVSEMVEL